MLRPDPATLRRMNDLAGKIRRGVLEQSRAANVGHIGSSLSVVEIIATLWGGLLRHAGTEQPNRDRFVLCKGHAALALYVAMHHAGLMDEATLGTYCADGTHLGVHPEACLAGIDVATGSLGQGLSVACGLAHGLRLRQSPARVFALLSDAECNEGQVWEAAQFAAHHRLSHLTAIIDANGSQALGPTRDVLNLAPMAARWEAFGWDAVEVDGHDTAQLAEALIPRGIGMPRLVVARTVLGKGVGYMENQVAWHYLPMSAQQYEQALNGLEAVA